METIKISRKVTSATLRIDELKKWMGKEVDIIIVEKKANLSGTETPSAAGILERYKNTNMKDKEKTAWAMAVQEKHGNS